MAARIEVRKKWERVTKQLQESAKVKGPRRYVGIFNYVRKLPTTTPGSDGSFEWAGELRSEIDEGSRATVKF